MSGIKQSDGWTIGDKIRWAITGIVLFLFTTFLTANLEKLAEERTWNTVLSRMVAKMPDISPLVDNAWFPFISGCFATIAVFLWSGWWRSGRSGHIKNAASAEEERQEAIQADIEFFATIDELRQKHPLPETFKQGNEIHAYFLSGEGVFAEHNDYIKCVRRLILPNPEAKNLATFQTVPLSTTYANFKSQITTTRNLAIKNTVQVRLFEDFIGMSLLFCNPDRRDGWVQVGLIIPGSESRERQHFRLYKATHEAAVLSLYKTFNHIWDASLKNTEEEDMQEAYAGVTTGNRPILQVPITIEFNPDLERFFNQEDRPSDVSVITERYREYYCTMFNDSDETLRNVSCEVATIVMLQNRPNDRQLDPQNIHEKLCFDLPTFPTRSDFSPRAREKLWLFSRVKKALDNEPIRLVKGSKSFHDKGRQMAISLRVTADSYAQKTFSVEAWVQDGILRMTGIRPEG